MGGVKMHETLTIFGVLLIVVGIGMLIVAKLGIPRLPGDIVIERDNFTFYFPIVTSIVLSLVLTLLLRWFR
jgi:formate hydrogenlyase subunit 3/multisubunit Na+/H+ antiporter MnhD subunit